MPHDARAVANYFLNLADEVGIPLSPMQVIKLVYFAHGWSLGITGEPLIEDTVQAWQYGPVIPSLYETFKKYRNKPITKPATDFFGHPITSQFSDVEKNIIERVFDEYSKYTAIYLSGLTHKEGTPWYQIWIEEGKKGDLNVPIRNELIQNYYSKLAN